MMGPMPLSFVTALHWGDHNANAAGYNRWRTIRCCGRTAVRPRHWSSLRLERTVKMNTDSKTLIVTILAATVVAVAFVLGMEVCSHNFSAATTQGEGPPPICARC